MLSSFAPTIVIDAFRLFGIRFEMKKKKGDEKQGCRWMDGWSGEVLRIYASHTYVHVHSTPMHMLMLGR